MNDSNEMNDAETALERLRQKHGKDKTTPTEKPPKDPEATDNEPDTDPEDATEKPEDNPKSGRKKTRNGPLKRLVDNHPRVTTGIILGVTAFTIAVAATSVAYATQTVDNKLDDITDRYQTSQKALDTQQDELQKALDTAYSTLSSVTDEQVLDESTLDNLKTTADEAKPLLTDPGEEPSSDEFILKRIYSYEQLTDACDKQENKVAENIVSVNVGIKSVNDSVTAKQRDDAMKATAAKVDEAKDVLDKSKDAVLDNANRDALNGLIDEANALVSNADATKEQLDDETNRLQGGIDSVNADMQAKVEHDEAIRKAEEEKKARGSASAGSSAFDTWTPSYYNAYGTAEADPMGGQLLHCPQLERQRKTHRVPPGTRHHQRDNLSLRLRDGHQPRHVLRRRRGILLCQQRYRLPDVLRGEPPHHALRAGVLNPRYTKKSARSSDRTLFFF